MHMNNRIPCRAGSFYAAQKDICLEQAKELLQRVARSGDVPGKICGGLVPHAGWSFSGELAAMTLQAILGQGDVDTLVILGADHTGNVEIGEVYDSGAWSTPFADVSVDEALAADIIDSSELLRSNPSAHAGEHSIEVQIPLIAAINPEIKIVPIAVPPITLAVEVGRCIGKTLEAWPSARVIGSSDLTHYGGHFGSPFGSGEKCQEYAATNDDRILSLIAELRAEEVIIEAATNRNACGAGAIAATLAAVQSLGAGSGTILKYTNSYRIVHEVYPESTEDTTVGYASVVFS